jgi:glycosyltransferase involved in cell wall biosynthesis
MALIRQLAKDNIQILGAVSDRMVAEYMSKAKAFIYAACEDFGIALVEAQACGTPVIAFAAGGALETVRDLRENSPQGTGLLFGEQNPQSLVEAVNYFVDHGDKIEPENCRQQANRFTPEVFRNAYSLFIEEHSISKNYC